MTRARLAYLIRTYLLYKPILRPLYYVIGVYYIYVAKPKRFSFRGQEYPYFAAWYGKTYLIERAVEIPVASAYVERYAGRRILEVGNVLPHFFAVDHDVVDKYEAAPGVLNVDVIDYVADEPYDLIVSVSTLEHVGWDEGSREPEKALRAIEHLVSMLASGGELVITWPIGWNHALDDAVRSGRLRFTEAAFLKRVSRIPRWREVEWPDVQRAQYGRPFRSANAVFFGVIREGALRATP